MEKRAVLWMVSAKKIRDEKGKEETPEGTWYFFDSYSK